MIGQPLTVLLVEDNPGDVELIKEALSDDTLCYELHVASDGLQAMSFLKRNGEFSRVPRPDIVLLDINLPKKNGHEVLSEVRADFYLKSLPVVIFTSSDRDKDVERSYQDNVNAYLTKPVEASEFIELVKQIENFWLSLVRLPSRSVAA